MPAEQTVEEYRKALEAEWSVYVATQPIDINGARAFNTGDPVPVSHVTGNVVPSDAVAKSTTKAAQAATDEKVK